MLRIPKENNIIVMSRENAPAARAKSGDTVIFETADAFGGQITSEADVFSSIGWDRVNPATGPLYIEGAEPGDCLKVDILDIKAGGKAAMVMSPGFGILEASAEKSFVFDIKEGKVFFDGSITIDIEPMIGVIGTAPAGGGVATGTPGPHGGNMDCKQIIKGAALYLPVNVPGALLSMGDLHAVMGDGEVAVCGAEMAGEVTVRVTVLKGVKAPLPVLISKNRVMTVASAPTLDEAAKTAAVNMRELLIGAGMDGEKANLLMSLVGDLRICQVVDPLMTARMEFNLDILKAYGVCVFRNGSDTR
ncbi:MAG: acetamidase/formamidase family protein [Clostridiales bacterium]|jgi:amidase|nr:acetamidase/formamidase family protein [Clostridiales bacterium]